MPKIPYTSGEETVGDSYPSDPKKVIIIDCQKVLIFLKNTHSSNSLTYKIVAYMDSDDLADSSNVLVDETVLAAGAVAVYALTDPYDAIALYWKNTVAGENATVKAWVNTTPRK